MTATSRPKNMMANQSYEQKIGLLTNTAYGSQPDSDPSRKRRLGRQHYQTITRWAAGHDGQHRQSDAGVQ